MFGSGFFFLPFAGGEGAGAGVGADAEAGVGLVSGAGAGAAGRALRSNLSVVSSLGCGAFNGGTTSSTASLIGLFSCFLTAILL